VIDDATNKKYDLFSSRFVKIGNEIVYDSVTNLLWTKNVKYLNKSFNYYGIVNAEKLCENLTIQGLLGWRLPTQQELNKMKSVFSDTEIHPFVNLGGRILYTGYGSSNSALLWPVRGDFNTK